MSNAIHSEIVELILTIDKFEKQITEANDSVNVLKRAIETPVKLAIDISATVSAMVQAKTAISDYRKEVEETDKAIQKMLLHQQQQVVLKRDGSANGGKVIGFSKSTGASAASEYAQAYKQQLDMDAAVTESRIASAKKVAGEELTLGRFKAAEYAQAYKQQLQWEQNLLSIERERALLAKSTVGYSFGNTLLSGKTGALATGAASASFLVGANNLGAMFYMMERMSYATGIGQQQLGVFAEKLGLVKMAGEGAEASIAAFGRGAMALGGILATLAAPIATMVAGNKLNQHLAEMSTLLADTTVKGEAFSGMMNEATASAVKLSGQFNTGIVDVVDGFKLALSTGIDASQMERFTEIALQMGKGLGASLTQSVSILTTFRDAFAGTVEDTLGYSDVLFNAINVGKFNIEQLNANIGRVAVTAAEAGVGFKDMMAALATLNRVGMTTSQAITSLNQMIVSIVNPSAKAQKTFDALGIAYGSAALKGRSLISVIDEIKSKVGNNNDLYGDLFSEERARRGAIGLAANPNLHETNRAEMEKTGTASVAAARAMDTFSTHMSQIFTTMWSVIQAIGSDLLNIAKDIFFPGGAMGKDTMAEIAVGMEVVGVVIKEIGIALLGVVGTAYNLLKVFTSIFSSIGYAMQGEFTKAFNVVSSSLSDLGAGIANSLLAMFKTVGVSADRANAYLKPTEKAVENLGKESEATSAKVTGISNAFMEMDIVSDHTATKIEKKFEKAREKLEEVRVAAIKAKIAMETPDVSAAEAPNEFSKLPGVKDSWQFSRYKGDIAWADDIQRRMNAFKDTDSTALWADLVRQREEAMVQITKSHKSLMDLVDKQRDEWAKKKKEASIAAKEDAAGVGVKQAKDAYGGFAFKDASTPDSVLAVTSTLDKLLALREKIVDHDLPKLEKMTVVQLQDRVGILYDQLSEAAKAFNSVNASAKDMDKLSYEKAINQVEQQRKDILKDISDTETQLQKAKDIAYAKEYNAALKLYNVKTSFYDKELAKIDAVIKAYDTFINGVQDKKLDLNMDRRGAGYAERAYRDTINNGIRDAGNMSDPKEALNRLKDIEKLVEKFVSAAKANGDTERGLREAQDFYDAVEKIAEAARTKEYNAKSITMDRKTKNENDLKTSMADNPVAQASFQYADKLVKEALDTAAKHGLSVSGDLVSDVEIKDININVPIESMRNAIIATVKVEMAKIYDDLAKKNPAPNVNSGAVGDL